VIDETAGTGGRSRRVTAQSEDAAQRRQLTAAKPAQRRINGAVVSPPRTAAVKTLYHPGRASPGARVFGVVGMSLGAHMAIMGALGFMPTPQEFFAAGKVEMEIIVPEAPPPPPPPPIEEPKPPEPEPQRPKAAPKPAAPKPAEPEPPKEEVKPAPEAPLDLTGVTLTGGDGSSWSSVTGAGGALTGPAPRVASVTGRDRTGSMQGVVGGKGDKPLLVAEASLSRKPVPPAGMDALLEQNYPSRARQQGVSGSAVVSVEILADGRVGEMKVKRETGGDYGFGTQCQKTLRVGRWQPPLDRRGQPVGTRIDFTCSFEVAY
jgi:periplasmic protein TonB